MKTATAIARHITALQTLLAKRFGKNGESNCGASTLSIARDRVELTDDHCHIVQRGPARVATVLRRKRRAR